MTPPSSPWRVLFLILLMGVGGGALAVGWFVLLQIHWGPIMESMPKDQTEKIMFIAFLEGLGLFMVGIFGIGFRVANMLRLSSDAVRLEAMKCFWSALLGIPTGVLLFALRWDGVARARLGSLELWTMTALSIKKGRGRIVGRRSNKKRSE